MSYKDVRDLFENLKILGYPKHLKISTLYTTQGSLENFELVFDILRWLIDQYEPGSTILGGTDTEVDRIVLARSCVEFFVTKAGLKLSGLRLYAATASSAAELMKVVRLIMKRPIDVISDKETQRYGRFSDNHIDDNIQTRMRGKELSIELTHLGASLYELLGKEDENQEKRNIQAGRQLEQSNVEKILAKIVSSANLKMSADKGKLEAAMVEKQAIASKVDRKKADLERLKQRLDTLQKIRPAFSEEFEKAEEELQKLYGIYMTHVRCLDALRAQANVNSKNATQTLSEPIKNGSAPASMVLLPEGILDLSDELSSDEEIGDEGNEQNKNTAQPKETIEIVEHGENKAAKAKLRIKTGLKKNDDSRFRGNMLETEGDSDLDSSLELNDDDSDTDTELDDIDNVEALYNFSETTGARKSAKPKLNHSDEEF